MNHVLKNGISMQIIKPVGDYDQISSLISKLSDESDNFPFSSEDFNISAENIGKYINYLNSRPNSIFYIAKVENEIVGIAYLEGGKRERTFHCTTLGLGVLKKYNNIGIGSILNKALVEFASNGEYIAKIELQVRSDNRAAINVYKKCGFILEGKSSRALFIEGEFYDYINMGMIID